MKFSGALQMLEMKVPMKRMAWLAQEDYIVLEDGLFKRRMYMDNVKHWMLIPYSFQHEDLLADDWEVVRQQNA